jgi:glycosyltransferase involved in cell wall biosynthesis
MKVLNVSLDPQILNPESVVASRAKAYGSISDEYVIVVPSPARMRVALSSNVLALGSGGQAKLIRLWHTVFLILRVVKEHKIDVITVQDPYYLGFICWIIAKYYHLGLEMQILGLEKLSPLRTALAKFTLPRASVVRALSPRLYERLHQEFSIPYEKMRIVTIYVDVKKLGLSFATLNIHEQKKFDEAVASFESSYKDRFNFLTVSRLVPIKNISLQLQAVEQLKTNHPEIFLHIVGGGPEEANIQREIKERGLENFVKLHGPQYHSDLGVFYIASDCFLLTSNYEGWGMVIVEALSAGLPVIMTAVGCADELIINGQSGVVVPIKDVPALTAAMEKMMSDRAWRNQIESGAVTALNTLPPLSEILQKYQANWILAEKNRL